VTRAVAKDDLRYLVGGMKKRERRRRHQEGPVLTRERVDANGHSSRKCREMSDSGRSPKGEAEKSRQEEKRAEKTDEGDASTRGIWSAMRRADRRSVESDVTRRLMDELRSTSTEERGLRVGGVSGKERNQGEVGAFSRVSRGHREKKKSGLPGYASKRAGAQSREHN